MFISNAKYNKSKMLKDYETLKYSDSIMFEFNYECYIYNDFKYLKDRIKVKGVKYENKKN